MACPTCGETMAYVSDNVMHCPRCGTVRQTVLGNVYVPKLVERCRQFTHDAADYVPQEAIDIWDRLGSAESIALPQDRPVSS